MPCIVTQALANILDGLTGANDMADDVQLLALCGSWGLANSAGNVLRTAIAGAEAAGATVHIWDLSTDPLPHVGSPGSWEDETVKRYQALAEQCDGFLVCTPEYHGTMSSLTKLQFDWLYFQQTEGKVFGLLATLGGAQNSNSLNHMRIVARWLHAWCVPQQGAVGNTKTAFDDDFQLADEGLRSRVAGVGTAVVEACKRLR